MSRLLLFEDPDFRTLPSCTATHVEQALACSIPRLRHAQLPGLDRRAGDLLILPYLAGNFSGPALGGVLRFHRQGGSLLLLGDTPHRNAWYPYRNSQASDLGLTRATDEVTLLGLSPRGREIWPTLPGLDRFLHRPLRGIRTTALPPDQCHLLFHGRGGFRDLSPAVWIDRLRPDWLGAKLAMVGFDGGEPRENVLGVCQLPHVHDPGLLDADWEGFAPMLRGLVAALEPRHLAVGLLRAAAVPTEQPAALEPMVRNLGDEALTDLVVDLTQRGCPDPRQIWKVPRLDAGERLVLPAVPHQAALGPTHWELRVRHAGHLPQVCRVQQVGYQEGCDLPRGFGFSSYASFPDGNLSPAFRRFVRAMKNCGTQYLRFAVAWEDVQPAPDQWDWTTVDQAVALCAEEGLGLYLWVFPTARGSGLSDAGIPEWVLREPAIDRDGRPGNFPCIWSPFYRSSYFAFLEALVRRYGPHPHVERFVFDFGNSDFAYCYHYYGGPGDVFDYSPHEQAAFARYLQHELKTPLNELSRMWGTDFHDHRDIPVPGSDQPEAWRVYDAFRRWGVHRGIEEACAIVQRLAPAKAPPDLPGHGLGSIADTLSYVYDAKRRHHAEERLQDPARVSLHNAGPIWGGEAWQVGGRYPDYDDALFQSLRLGADYLSIPGPDLGMWEEDIARVGMIRRTLQGAVRQIPEIAILDRMEWHQVRSLATLGTRLDHPVDLLNDRCWFDFSAYRLLVLPPEPFFTGARGPQSLLPQDPDYLRHLHQAVEHGLQVLLFPGTLRQLPVLADLKLGPRRPRRCLSPTGTLSGMAQSLDLPGAEVLWRDASDGAPLLLRRPQGRGAWLLAGWDAASDSFDAAYDASECTDFANHSLVHLLHALHIQSPRIRSGHLNLHKEWLRQGSREALLLFNPAEVPRAFDLTVRPDRSATSVFDLASGERFPLGPPSPDGWQRLQATMPPRAGRYFLLEASDL